METKMKPRHALPCLADAVKIFLDLAPLTTSLNDNNSLLRCFSSTSIQGITYFK